jgi:hypothetical protein
MPRVCAASRRPVVAPVPCGALDVERRKISGNIFSTALYRRIETPDFLAFCGEHERQRTAGKILFTTYRLHAAKRRVHT